MPMNVLRPFVQPNGKDSPQAPLTVPSTPLPRSRVSRAGRASMHSPEPGNEGESVGSTVVYGEEFHV